MMVFLSVGKTEDRYIVYGIKGTEDNIKSNKFDECKEYYDTFNFSKYPLWSFLELDETFIDFTKENVNGKIVVLNEDTNTLLKCYSFSNLDTLIPQETLKFANEIILGVNEAFNLEDMGYKLEAGDFKNNCKILTQIYFSHSAEDRKKYFSPLYTGLFDFQIDSKVITFDMSKCRAIDRKFANAVIDLPKKDDSFTVGSFLHNIVHKDYKVAFQTLMGLVEDSVLSYEDYIFFKEQYVKQNIDDDYKELIDMFCKKNVIFERFEKQVRIADYVSRLP